MNRSLLLESSEIYEESNTIDRIRQTYLDLQTDPLEENVEEFLIESQKFLENQIEINELRELINTISFCFSKFTSELLPILKDFMSKFQMNANYIIAHSEILVNLIDMQTKINLSDYNSFVEKVITEILPQIKNEFDNELQIFGHQIPIQFQDELIINLLLLTNLDDELLLNFSPYLIENNYDSTNPKYKLFFQKLTKLNLIKILPQTEKSNNEFINFLINQNMVSLNKLDKAALSIIECAHFSIKFDIKDKIKWLNEDTILQFAAALLVLSKNKPSIFSNDQFLKMVQEKIKENNDSPVLVSSLNAILSNVNFLTFTNLYEIMNDVVYQIQYYLYNADKMIAMDTIFKLSHSYLPKEKLDNNFVFFEVHKKVIWNCIIQNLKEISKSNKIGSNKLNMNIIDQEILANYLQDLSSADELIQMLFFMKNLCINQPKLSLTKEFSSKLNLMIDEEIAKKNFDVVSLIIDFMNHNDIKISKDKCDSAIPNEIKQKIFGWIPNNEDNIDDLLNAMLSDPVLEQKESAFELLYNIMMKDKDLALTYLGNMVCKYFKTIEYATNAYLRMFSKEYEKYTDDFIQITKNIFNYDAALKVLFVKSDFRLTSLPISKYGLSIVNKLFDSIAKKKNNFQAFLCLKSIASSFPNLFSQNPQKIFDTVLPFLDNFYLIYELKEEGKDEENFLAAKTSYAALEFLYSSLHSVIVLEEFVNWLFSNIQNFSKSQVFCCVLILLSFFNENKIWILLYVYIEKYDFLSKIGQLLDFEDETSSFGFYYKQYILMYIFQIYENLTKMNSKVLIQIDEFKKIEHPLIYIYDCSFSVFPSVYIYGKQKLEGICKDFQEFINKTDKTNEYWLSFNFDKNRKKEPSASQIDEFVSKLPINESFEIPSYCIKYFKDYTINMVRYLVTKPFWIYSWFLFDDSDKFSLEMSGTFLQTFDELKEIQENGYENPQDLDNANINEFNETDYLLPYYCQETLFRKLVNGITCLKSKDKCFSSLVNVLKTIAKNSLSLLSILDFISEKITEISLGKRISSKSFNKLFNLIDFLNLISNSDNFKENFFDICGRNLLNTVMLPQFRDASNIFISVLKLFNIFDEMPNSIIQFIGFSLLLNNNEIITSALKICYKLDIQKIYNIIKLILVFFDDKKHFDENSDVFIDFLKHFPSISKEIIPKLHLLIDKLLNEYMINLTDINKLNSFKNIGILFNLIAPDRGISTNLIEIIQEPTTIPQQIWQISPQFWSLFDKYKSIIMEKIEENPLLLDSFKFILDFPELISFNIRSSYFRKKMKLKTNQYSSLVLKIDFNNLLLSSFNEINRKSSESLLNKFEIEIPNSNVLDHGGVTREWFTKLAKEIFNQNYGLFNCSKTSLSYQPNGSSYVHSNHLDYFKFAGKFIARALIEGVCIDAHLTTSFCKQILHRQPNFNDLKDVDEELYKSCEWILQNDVEPLDFYFEIDTDDLGVQKTIELIENGSQIKVTNENKKEFVELRTNYILEKKIEEQIRSFCSGFDSLISHEEIRIFTPHELDMLLCGIPEIDVNDFKKHISFEHPYNQETPVVNLFFQAIEKWGNDDLVKLLIFMTGTSRLGVNGFDEFCEMTNSELIIASGGNRVNLPQSHTCSNTLDLPQYESEEELNEKLRKAIDLCNSFENI